MYQSQNKTIKKHLKECTSITSLYAINHYGITRLARCIYDLKKEGMNIDKNTIINGRSHYAEYYLVEESCLQNTK